MQKVADIFKAWPSLAEFVRDLGVPYQTASAWKARGSISSEHWLAIVHAARRRGNFEITTELLARLHARQPNPANPNGFAEEGATMPALEQAEGTNQQTGHFSRWKQLRVPHYATADDTVRHIDALRDEWERR